LTRRIESARRIYPVQPAGSTHPIIQKNRDAIFEDVADQQIEIDLDAGVQANYPKFGEAVAGS